MATQQDQLKDLKSKNKQLKKACKEFQAEYFQIEDSLKSQEANNHKLKSENEDLKLKIENCYK